ncbi:tyrosinase family protein [Sphingosinicella sp. BN140058]|uniref:tyrosinase family protein n=1 Tax=Sphingosinicella sp. BN140058 TaxID=1892855 RepID=UPI0010113232|nr:tyrosinase family protein [Sphingosinicella sp. BN140058]QAY78433.1 tyrosinase family protein [Sphingosinicella sp. BN140058]
MRYLRLACGMSSVAALAVLGAYSTSGAAQSNVKLKPSASRPQVGPVLKGPVLLTGIRKSITALSAAEVASLRKGYAQMIAWNSAPPGSANFRRSLKYWANMHAYFGTGCANASGLSNPGMNGLAAQAKSNADENATWCTCQHGTSQFLTWHRMYLYYFEKVLQAAAGDPKLRLPYWDYESDAHVPAAYRAQTYVDGSGQTVPNPLFVANRQAQLNAGTGTLSPGVVSTAGAMPANDYLTFNGAIEQTPHGAVHCATGVANCPSGYMGAVPAAGNDPIFYSHHANIDRLYECWLKVNPAQRLPSGTILNASFSFIDGSGNLVSRIVSQMKTVQQLGYTYTVGGGCPAVRRLPPFALQAARTVPLLGPTPIETGTTSVPLPTVPRIAAPNSGNQPESGGAARQATLVIDDLSFEEAPGVMYEVALQDANGRRIVVGVINFFNRTAPHAHSAAESGAVGAGDHRFDATAALQALGGGQNAKLVLQPTSGILGAGTEAAVVPNPRANVRLGAVRLELR